MTRSRKHDAVKRLAHLAGIATLVVLIPLTFYLVISGTTHLLFIIIWIALAVVVALYSIILRSASKRAEQELRDVRERHAADQGQLTTILNSMGVGIASVSPNGVIKLYNASLLGLLNTNKDIVGKNISDVMKLINSEDRSAVDIMSLASKKSQTKNDEFILPYDEDDEIRLSIVINPIRGSYNRLKGYIFIIDDVTKAKSLEEERDEFISVMNHELRTPIAIAEASVSNAQLLLDRDANKKTLRNTFEDAHSQIVFLANMVNDLGTLSRSERGIGDDKEPVNVDELANDLHTKYAPQAREHKLYFNLDIVGRIGSVETSRLYLEEVLQNLITNAIKYTKEGTVTLHIHKDNSRVHFAVKDTGIGISKTDQKRIFEKFYRSEDYRTRETSGTGLGLYVVQKLARKIGIKIDIESRINHGSTFSFTLPVK